MFDTETLVPRWPPDDTDISAEPAPQERRSIEVVWPPHDEFAPLKRAGKTGWAGICRLGGVGDNLIAASVLRPLKKLGYKIDVIAEEPQHVVFENNPFVDKLSVKVGPRDLPQGDMQAWQNWFATRANEYDLFVNLSHSCEGLIALFPAMSAFYWPAEFRRKLCDRSYIEAVHDIVGVPYEFGPLFFSTEAEKSKALETKSHVAKSMGDGRVIAWCLSGTRIDKIYPYAPMAIARIIREIGLPVVMLGAPGKDHDMAKVIMDHVERQNGDHKGLYLGLSPDPNKPSWPIRRILSFAQQCDLMIGPDTGPSWSVAFEKTPKIIMVSHASPVNITKHWVNTVTLHADRTRVPCWPCHQLHDVIGTCTPNKENNGAACISDISVERLLTEVQRAVSST